MKPKLVLLFATVLLMSIAGIGLVHSQAYAETDETLKANVPFAFYAGKQVMPAGTYSIGIDVQNRLLTIVDADEKNHQFLPAMVSGDGSDEDALVFDHIGDQYYLKGLKSDAIDMSVPVNERDTATASADGATHEQIQVAMSR
jgi:hypothetical protein